MSKNQETKPMKYTTYYFYPQNSEEPQIVMIVNKDELNKQRGPFKKTWRRFESKGWSIQEIKPKEKKYAKKSIHPQTGELV